MRSGARMRYFVGVSRCSGAAAKNGKRSSVLSPFTAVLYRRMIFSTPCRFGHVATLQKLYTAAAPLREAAQGGDAAAVAELKELERQYRSALSTVPRYIPAAPLSSDASAAEGAVVKRVIPYLRDFDYCYDNDGYLRRCATDTPSANADDAAAPPKPQGGASTAAPPAASPATTVRVNPFIWLGQRHYDGVGDAVTCELYDIMQLKYGLSRVQVPLPEDAPADAAAASASPSRSRRDGGVDVGASVPIFVSPNFERCDTAFVIIQGSGAVRPGMWARSLCINGTLQEGSIFPYLDDISARAAAARSALGKEYGVIILNPNENMPDGFAVRRSGGEGYPGDLAPAQGDDALQYWIGSTDAEYREENIARRKQQQSKGPDVPRPAFLSPEEHASYVYGRFVAQNPCIKHVVIIAHSYGGVCTSAIMADFADHVERHVLAICLTDAINHMWSDPRRQPSRDADVKRLRREMLLKSRNWVASSEPRGTVTQDRHAVVRKALGGVPKMSGRMAPSRATMYRMDPWTQCVELSSGHTKHENTSEACRPALFEYVDECLRQAAATTAGSST